MNEDEIKEHNKNKKYNVFMGTITLCVVYAIIALLLLLYASYTESGKSLYTNLKPFAITYIFGTIIIIVSFSIIIFNYDLTTLDSKKINKNPLNPTSCPDYYDTKIRNDTDADLTELITGYSSIEQNKYLIGASSIYDQPQPQSDLDDNTQHPYAKEYVDFYDLKPSEDNKHKFKVKCERDSDIFESNYYLNNDGVNVNFGLKTTGTNGEIVATTTGTRIDNQYPSTSLNGKERNTMVGALLAMENGINKTNTDKKKITSVSSGTTGDAENYRFKCDHVYPEYLTSLDLKEYNANGQTGPINKYRCEFAKQCGIDWSEAGC
tara:strand:- start:21531 stop:22493 length:963 start_codon:yes stop_codon:yes gene_type:complete